MGTQQLILIVNINIFGDIRKLFQGYLSYLGICKPWPLWNLRNIFVIDLIQTESSSKKTNARINKQIEKKKKKKKVQKLQDSENHPNNVDSSIRLFSLYIMGGGGGRGVGGYMGQILHRYVNVIRLSSSQSCIDMRICFV